MTCNGCCPYLELPIVQTEMNTSRANVTVSILAMLVLVLLTSPFVLEMDDKGTMKLGLIRKGVNARDLSNTMSEYRQGWLK